MNRISALCLFIVGVLAACTSEPIYIIEHDRVVSATDCDTVFEHPPEPDVGVGSSESSSSSTGGGDEGGFPTPTATCPTFANGRVTFCPAELDECREVLLVNVNGANGTGPLEVWWHGTYGTPENDVAWDYSFGQIRNGIVAEHGIVALPAADPEAISGANDPFPWFIVCSAFNMTDCDRPDDFILMDEVVACAVEQELVDPNRILTGGMSAGGIMTSYLVDTVDYLAAAVVYSGGLPVWDRPAVPASPDTPVMVINGGPTDTYCGAGTMSCYDFQDSCEEFQSDVADNGNFVIGCEHPYGHNDIWIGGINYFYAQARLGMAHPLETYTFGSGFDWGLNTYCEAI